MGTVAIGDDPERVAGGLLGVDEEHAPCAPASGFFVLVGPAPVVGQRVALEECRLLGRGRRVVHEGDEHLARHVNVLVVVPVVPLGCDPVADEDEVGPVELDGLPVRVRGGGEPADERDLDRFAHVGPEGERRRLGHPDAPEGDVLGEGAAGHPAHEAHRPVLLDEVGDGHGLARCPGAPPLELVRRERGGVRTEVRGVDGRERGVGRARRLRSVEGEGSPGVAGLGAGRQ